MTLTKRFSNKKETIDWYMKAGVDILEKLAEHPSLIDVVIGLMYIEQESLILLLKNTKIESHYFINIAISDLPKNKSFFDFILKERPLLLTKYFSSEEQKYLNYFNSSFKKATIETQSLLLKYLFEFCLDTRYSGQYRKKILKIIEKLSGLRNEHYLLFKKIKDTPETLIYEHLKSKDIKISNIDFD